MTKADLISHYKAYINCLNAQDWENLGTFVHPDASHNGQSFGLSGYRKMLENDFIEIPDLQFHIELLSADPPLIAARLAFDCHPRGTFFGLKIKGQRLRFTENVFYQFRDGKIWHVWSVIDKAAIEAQLAKSA